MFEVPAEAKLLQTVTALSALLGSGTVVVETVAVPHLARARAN